MAIIQSGAYTDNLTIGSSYKTLNSVPYDSRGYIACGYPAYSACTPTKFIAVAGTTPFAQLFNNGPKIVRVSRVQTIGQCATAAVNADLVVTKRTAIGTGGTATVLTTVSKDRLAPLSSTIGKVFTAAPTAGQGGNVITTQSVFLSLLGTPAIQVGATFDFLSLGQEPLILRTGQGIELSFATTTTNACTLTCMFEWMEF